MRCPKTGQSFRNLPGQLSTTADLKNDKICFSQTETERSWHSPQLDIKTKSCWFFFLCFLCWQILERSGSFSKFDGIIDLNDMTIYALQFSSTVTVLTECQWVKILPKLSPTKTLSSTVKKTKYYYKTEFLKKSQIKLPQQWNRHS